MGLSIDGLISGQDTTTLINNLIAVEAIPQTLLKGKVTAAQSYTTAVQGLNTQVATLADAATKAAKPASYDLYTATSSSSQVTATTSTGAAAGVLDVTVGRLAQNQVTVTEPLTAWPETTLTLTDAAGKATVLTPASDSLDDVVSAVNAAGLGITATKVAVGTGAFRVQFSSTAPGAANAFTVTGGTVPITQVKDAQDAQVTLWAGTAAEQSITSGTNTFTNLLPGLDVTVSAISTTPITLTVTRDDAAITKMAGGLVGSLNDIFAVITNRSAVSTTTDSTGKTVTTAGLFAGDSTIRTVRQDLITAASMPVNGHSPSEIGISITKSGTLEFDAEKFAAALVKDPAGTMKTVQEISGRVATAAASASDKYDGTLTATVTSQQSQVRTMGLEISDWDLRLTAKRSSLERTYTAMESRLGELKSQSAWLTSQIASLLPAYTGGSSS
ncbi:flagellar filament capping protein FliD [Cryobacterium sp. PAMC25264]|uniref:flagellar filament capping protein FliD n=1 Tax=Cryobacterium sp. PAMC25264 TaxID=2861288 RepID=UPI001C633496|nr:flagellar filament capping protein FliD [Cryobacterium sp. PAMC25264]QYF74653.1 flagellar filament capping protein FliD [Cryobacterium sp. PAMC25264]